MKLTSIAKGLALAGALSLTGLALATNAIADGGPRRGSIKDAPYVAPFSWTGLYIGANVGGAWTKTDSAWDPLPTAEVFGIRGQTYNLDSSGLIGGLHGGYNWQANRSWVLGLEADFSWTDLGRSSRTSNDKT